MLTKADIQLVRSLNSRKGRRREGLFVAEGPRLVVELLGHFECRALYATTEWLHGSSALEAQKVEEITQGELSRLSLQQSPNQVVALFRIPEDRVERGPLKGLHLALDNVQDPGNLGTIIRMADWFGVEDIWCSPTTADVWNPKVVQASMGGLAHVRVHYLDLLPFLLSQSSAIPVFGTSLSGNSIWDQQLAADAIIVMGNEGNGISPEVDERCTHRLFIPNYPQGRTTTDSLNVAMATGIVLAEFRRRLY